MGGGGGGRGGVALARLREEQRDFGCDFFFFSLLASLLTAKKGAPASVANAVKLSWGGLWEAAGSLRRSEHISSVHWCHLYTPAHMENIRTADTETSVRLRIPNS